MISGIRQRLKLSMKILLLLIICVIWSNTAKADGLMDVIYTEEETHENHSTAYAMQRGRGAYLAGGIASIEEIAVGELNLFGSTDAFEDCDMLTLIMYLERKTGDSYYTYQYWDFYDYNTNMLGRSINIIVPRNCFYRLRTYHSIKKGVTRESAIAETLGVWID